MNRSSPNVVSVALVVGAGGPTGGPFIHAALERIHDMIGWVPAAASNIIGTSAGAFVAAWVDEDPVPTTAQQLAGLRLMANGDDHRSGARDRLATVMRRAGGIALAAAAPSSRPVDDYRVPPSPYHPGAQVVTVRRGSARRVVWTLKDASDPAAVVRASAAIPGVNRPVEVDGVDHVDGAVHSAANVDVASASAHDALIVIAPMVPATGGPLVGRLHRAQLRTELRPFLETSTPTIVILPDEAAHANRRDREAFAQAGGDAVARLAPDLFRDSGHIAE